MKALILCLLFILGAASAGFIKQVYLDIGKNLGRRVSERMSQLLSKVSGLRVLPLSSFSVSSLFDRDECLVLGLGNGTVSGEVISDEALSSLTPEGFRLIRTERHSYSDMCRYLLASNGLPLDPHTHTNVSFNKLSVHYGAVVAAYASLEHLGFAFLHPLEPYIPSALYLKNCHALNHDLLNNQFSINQCEVNVTEAPYWPERAFHIHTQHPLELTEVLQGYDIPHFGPHGPFCSSFSRRNSTTPEASVAYCERWEDMVDDVNRMYEWMVANRLNKVEWLLLGNSKWGDEMDTRIKRFRILTSLSHDYSLLVGADCPLVNQQQHAWSMLDPSLPFPAQKQAIRDRVDWIFNAGFDFVTTESGLSEFTHPDCELMLGLIDEFADYANKTWGREAGIKVHCSTGQRCEGYLDPNTGDPINFNFLTAFATSSLAVFPHTVQVYALDDPTAGAYGNDNFKYIEDYMVSEAKSGNRSVIFYGETAYWVNVDIDVPLFLPLYGQRRQHDLRRIATREIREGFRIDGQMNFDSGWEWGYWLSDVVTARASWDPLLPPDFDIHYNPKDDQWNAFSRAIEPFTRVFDIGEDSSIGSELNSIIVELTKTQERLIVLGRVNESSPCVDIKKLSGFGYLSGCDTWTDLPRMFGLAFLQADKVHMKETSDPLWPHVIPLLHEMERAFNESSKKMHKLLLKASVLSAENVCETSSALVPSSQGLSIDVLCNDVAPERSLNRAAIALLSEIADCTHLLAMRATHVRMLYESMVAPMATDKANLQRQSRAVINNAMAIVAKRESAYRVPWQRIASWRENPTVYRYGYLWAVHSLYYWWRDQGLAEGGSLQSEHSPCYLNRIDASEVAVGWGRYTLEIIRSVINWLAPFFFSGHPFEVVNCVSPPPEGYEFPRDLYPL